MQTVTEDIHALHERIANLEKVFAALNFLTQEMRGKILHFQSRRDLLASLAVLDQMDPCDDHLHYFESGITPDFTMNGFLRHNAANKITAVELLPVLKILPKLVADKALLIDFIDLAGAVACKARGPAGKELRGIKNDWKKLLEKVCE